MKAAGVMRRRDACECSSSSSSSSSNSSSNNNSSMMGQGLTRSQIQPPLDVLFEYVGKARSRLYYRKVGVVMLLLVVVAVVVVVVVVADAFAKLVHSIP